MWRKSTHLSVLCTGNEFSQAFFVWGSISLSLLKDNFSGCCIICYWDFYFNTYLTPFSFCMVSDNNSMILINSSFSIFFLYLLIRCAVCLCFLQFECDVPWWIFFPLAFLFLNLYLCILWVSCICGLVSVLILKIFQIFLLLYFLSLLLLIHLHITAFEIIPQFVNILFCFVFLYFLHFSFPFGKLYWPIFKFTDSFLSHVESTDELINDVFHF